MVSFKYYDRVWNTHSIKFKYIQWVDSRDFSQIIVEGVKITLFFGATIVDLKKKKKSFIDIKKKKDNKMEKCHIMMTNKNL